MPNTNSAACGHTYTSLQKRVFRCLKNPHPNKPNEHYFVRDLLAENAARNAPINHLISVPGERT